jgi:CRP-like cAMP-binding protein
MPLRHMAVSDTLLKKLTQHSRLVKDDISVIRRLTCQLRELEPEEDFIRQGDRPHASCIIMEGMMARYHVMQSGVRQYLSVHLAGDWPDAQGLFLEKMDHSVCAIGRASVCTIPHAELTDAFRQRPTIGFAIWRETLIDASIFREAITNNSARRGVARLAHFFCEVYYRSGLVDLVKEGVCALPFSQTMLGELLGMSLVSVNRHLQSLRKYRVADFKNGDLIVTNWQKLAEIGEFDPLYLHQVVETLT